jgi:hypothetical protein
VAGAKAVKVANHLLALASASALETGGRGTTILVSSPSGSVSLSPLAL